MKILVLGGCGYVGSKLILSLIKHYEVTVIDNQWFGNFLPSHKNLKVFKEDVRNVAEKHFLDKQAVIHLANIANDPSVELNQMLSWDVNVLQSIKLIKYSIKHGISKFIFASSGSVYGIKKEDKVTEDLDLVPISTYNKTKMVAERIFESYRDKISIYNIRPATVCGISPRMRFDLTVNMFVRQAIENKKITVHGGKQIRPSIHIDDLVNVYKHFLKNKLPSGAYNAGFENFSVLEIAKLVSKYINCEIEIKNILDSRSYRLNSDKLLNTKFEKKFGVEIAIQQLIDAIKNKDVNIDETTYTVSWMKKNGFK